MLFALLLVLLLEAPAVSAPSGNSNVSGKRDNLLGIWRRRGVICAFDTDRNMRVERTGIIRQTVRGNYSWMRIAEHDIITFRKSGPDSLDREVYLIGNVTDSTAVIALGTPFVRADSSRGLSGLWKHMERYERVDWRFGPNRISYHKTVYDPNTGVGRLVETHEGPYYRDRTAEAGSFTVEFPGGKSSTILPIVYRDLLYLFDLSQGKSFFVREKPPLVDEPTPPPGE